MKQALLKKVIITVIISFMFIIEGSSQYRSNSPGANPYAACSEQCKPFQGRARYQCLKTCVAANRRSRRKEGRQPSKYSKCAEVCKALKGIDGVKCIRLCMDRGSNAVPDRKKKGESSMLKSCKRRCEVLDGNYRYRCISACYNRHRR